MAPAFSGCSSFLQSHHVSPFQKMIFGLGAEWQKSFFERNSFNKEKYALFILRATAPAL